VEILTAEEHNMAKIQIRRDTSTNWSNVNPILSSGEFGYETDTGKLKIGNGLTSWNSASYFSTATISGSGDFTAASSSLASRIETVSAANIAASASIASNLNTIQGASTALSASLAQNVVDVQQYAVAASSSISQNLTTLVSGLSSTSSSLASA